MSNSPVNLHADGPPVTRLESPPDEAATALAAAMEVPDDARRDAVAGVVARWPLYLEAWARLGDHGRDQIERYAAYRVGYHRGLDTLRAAGWRGSGYVPYSHGPNQGFLDSLAGLAAMAHELGETDEATRCREFLVQLDPARFRPLEPDQDRG